MLVFGVVISAAAKVSDVNGGLAGDSKHDTQQHILSGLFADGGVVANNPTLAAAGFLPQIMNTKDNTAKAAVLSLGCGAYVGSMDVCKRYGGFAWLLPLTDILVGAGVETVRALGEELILGVSSCQQCCAASSIGSCASML